MKSKISFILLLTLALLGLRSAAFATDEPEATTDSYEVMAGGNATLRGTVLANSASTTVTFEYGTTTSYGQVGMTSITNFAAYRGGTVTAMIMGLNTTATYHFRIKAQNSFGITYGNDMTFNPSAPVAVTKESTAVSTSSETLLGEAHGWGVTTTLSFEYGMTDSYGSTVAATPGTVSGSTLTPVSALLTGLSTGPVYHYRLKAVNAYGTSYGADRTFQTGRPTLTTLASTSLTPAGVKLQGSVKLNGQTVTLKFEYGVTTAYGTEVQISVPGGASTSAQPVSYDLTSANSQISYHYRLKATGNGATTYSQDMTTGFPAGRPIVSTLPATNVTDSGATLNGTVNANGSTATVTFQYGTTSSYGSSTSATPVSVTGSVITNVLASNILPSNTWHYRVVATNAAGTSYGADITVNIPPQVSGSLPHPGVSGVASTSIIVNQTLTLSRLSLVFEYGKTKEYGSSLLIDNSATARIGGLAPGTGYHCRYRVTTPSGIFTNPDYAFTTRPTDPRTITVETLPVSYQSGAEAVLNGHVDGKGRRFVAGFKYGTSLAYSNTTSLFYSDSDGSPPDFAKIISNLQPATTYHFQAYAESDYSDTTWGGDQVFTTPAAGVVVATTQPASEITTTSARLNGYFHLNGGVGIAPAVFEYGTTPALGQSITAPFFGQGATPTRPPNFNIGYADIPISGVHVRYYYRVRAKNDRSTSFGEILSFLTPDPHDATLASFSVEGMVLNEPFLPTTTAYTATVPYETQSVRVAATAAEGITLLTLNNGQIEKGHLAQVMPLQVGANNFSLQVTSWDGSVQQTFLLTVTREPLKAGSIDASFGSNGRVTTDTGSLGGELTQQILIQPDGKILLLGNSDGALVLARYLPDGRLDTSFASEGIGIHGIEGHILQGASLALQPDGKILVVGAVQPGTTTAEIYLQRFLSDGSIDTTFHGTVIPPPEQAPTGDTAMCITLQGDGKILVGGANWDGINTAYLVLRRYLPNGNLDTSFNGTGKVAATALGPNSAAYGIAEQGGRIAICGVAGNSAIVACYTSIGEPDLTFNGTGLATLSTADYSEANDVLFQPSGEILIAGRGDNAFLLARYKSDGSLDPSFNGTGFVNTHFGLNSADVAKALVRQPDGKIILAGSSSSVDDSFALARFNVDGSLDASFGHGGKVLQSFGKCYHGANSVALQDDGKIIAAGDGCLAISQDISLLRLLGDGPGIIVTKTPTTPLFDAISNLEIFGPPNANTTVPLTITNTGSADLTGVSISITGADAADFTAVTIPAAPVPALAPNASMTLSVSFLRSNFGTSNAVLRITSNVSGNNGSYDIPLIGKTLPPQELWRQTWFGNSTNTEGAADLADPDKDGVVNLLEYALGLNPNVSSTAQLPQPTVEGDDFVLSFTQPTDVSGVTYGAEWTASLEGNNWQPVTDTGTAPQHIFRVSRTGKPLLFMRIRVGTTGP